MEKKRLTKNGTSILSFKPGHDGSLAYIKDGNLEFSYEAEKDSYRRYSSINVSVVLDALTQVESFPNIIALSGWVKGLDLDELTKTGSGYNGFDTTSIKVTKSMFLGKEVDMFTSSHERSHIIGAYAMSPFFQGEPCYALIWEGRFGSFYEIDGQLQITKLGNVMNQPGVKYSFLYFLASPNEPKMSNRHAGKLMALAGFSDRGKLNSIEQNTANFILNNNIHSRIKDQMAWSPFYNIGVENEDFKQFSGRFSNLIFDVFHSFAKKHCIKGYPLLIGGGCGLNCEWNTKWKNSNLFSDVFVAPVTNDTGSAIGTAADALFHFTGQAKLSWDVYCGQPFKNNHDEYQGISFSRQEFDATNIAKVLTEGKILGLAHGKCEIGPRALGNRSMIAAPFNLEIKQRLNTIKKRENYRPIAPVCLEEDVSRFFDWNGPSPYMLYFQKVISPDLKAITHVDNTARLQTVSKKSNTLLHKILVAFKEETGFGVLCNTSLNFPGTGFINSLHDLKYFTATTGLDGFVTEDGLYLKN